MTDLNRTGRESSLPRAVAAVIEGIEADVIRGVILPRGRLIEDHLMEDYGAKRHAVRAALEELERAGIVVKPRHRGAELRRFTPEEIDALYDTRAILHRAAVQHMSPPTEEEAAALEAALSGHEAACETGDLVAIHQANMAFHDALFGLCANPYLAAAIRHHDWLSFPIRAYGVADAGALSRARAEHRDMVELVRASRLDELEDLVVRHMGPARDIYTARFISGQVPRPGG
ncbi:MAG: GntR family transcriptional regulator [Bauldia sp.]|nr:GntR family transcriptional regulator [Bauldia sp.]